MNKHKEPTAVSLVGEALRRADDFLTAQQLRIATGVCANRVSAALHHLQKHKAADATRLDGCLYWYATPETDDRCRTVNERTPETKPRKTRKRRVAPSASRPHSG